MATNKITIEVDYGKSVARIGELELTFKQLEQAATKSRNAIKKAVRDTETSLAGTVKALTRERAALVESQSTLARNNEEYRKFQRQIDLVSKQIERLTDTRKKEEVTLKNSANGLKQQIALIQQEMNNRKLSNTQYRLMQEEVEKLEARYNSLTNTVKEGTIAGFDQQISALQRQQREVATNRVEIDKLEQQIISLKNRKAELAAGTREATKAQEGMSSSAGAAGAVVTEFGRTIGDAPFGLMGMANNLQQLSQQFVDLQAKSGGTREALIRFKNTLMGPAGFVVAINVVTSAILYFQRQNSLATKQVEKFDESILKNITTLTNYVDVANDANITQEQRNEILRAGATLSSDIKKLLDDETISEDERSRRIEKALTLEAKLIGLKQRRASLLEEYDGILGKNILNEQEMINAQNKLAEARKLGNVSAQTTINNILAEVGAQGERRRALELFLKIQLDIIDAEKEYADALDTSSEEISDYIEKLKELSREKSLESFGDGVQKLEEELKLLRADSADIFTRLGADSQEFLALMVEIAEKEAELRKAKKSANEEAAAAEAKRLEELADLNQKYTDNLESQGDELGLIRLMQQERDAIKEAKALGASQDLINKITQDFANQRQEILDKDAEERTEKEKKETEKAEKEKNKIKEKALKDNQKKIEEYFDKEIESMKARTQMMSDILTNFSTLLDELDSISQARFQRQINALKVERDVIRSNDELTKEEKEAQLTAIQAQENEIQVKRIKSERDMFTLKQTIALAELVMKQKVMIQEQIMLAQLAAAKANLTAQDIALTGAAQVGKAQMSIGEFMQQLGPFGIAAFALSIGGVIASIVSARRKAQAEIAGLSNAPISLGGGSSASAAPAAPDFNVVGASSQNQLARAIAGSQSEPVRAYVVSSDVTTAQELDRKIVEGASI